jgi:hypothetical protein
MNLLLTLFLLVFFTDGENNRIYPTHSYSGITNLPLLSSSSIRFVNPDEEEAEDEIGCGIEENFPCFSIKYTLETQLPVGEEGIVRVKSERVKEEKKMIIISSSFSIVGDDSSSPESTVI